MPVCRAAWLVRATCQHYFLPTLLPANTSYCHHYLLPTLLIVSTTRCQQYLLQALLIASTTYCQHYLLPALLLPTLLTANTTYCQHYSLPTLLPANTPYCQHGLLPTLLIANGTAQCPSTECQRYHLPALPSQSTLLDSNHRVMSHTEFITSAFGTMPRGPAADRENAEAASMPCRCAADHIVAPQLS